MQNSLSNNWRKVPISSVVDIYLGGTPSRAVPGYWNGDVKWISIQDISNSVGRYIENTAETITQEGVANSAAKILPMGTAVISSRGTVGEIGMLSEPMAFNQSCYGLLPKDNNQLDQTYLYYALKNSVRTAKNIAHGGVFDTFTKDTFNHIDLNLPKKIDEQEQIASILSSFDDKIELNNKISKTLEEMAQVIFKEWFVNFHFSRYEKIEFIDNELGKIPVGWRVGNLSDILELIYGKALKENQRKEGKVLVIGSSGIVGSNNEKLVSGPGIVVGRKGNVGSILWVDEDFYPIDTTFYVKPKKGLHYCYCLLKKQIFITGDSAVPGLNRDVAYKNTVIVPDDEIIEKFEIIATPIFLKLAKIKKENQKLATLRDLLLPKLMKGEIRI